MFKKKIKSGVDKVKIKQFLKHYFIKIFNIENFYQAKQKHIIQIKIKMKIAIKLML